MPAPSRRPSASTPPMWALSDRPHLGRDQLAWPGRWSFLGVGAFGAGWLGRLRLLQHHLWHVYHHQRRRRYHRQPPVTPRIPPSGGHGVSFMTPCLAGSRRRHAEPDPRGCSCGRSVRPIRRVGMRDVTRGQTLRGGRSCPPFSRARARGPSRYAVRTSTRLSGPTPSVSHLRHSA
jgi:hypothetical protein